jgi:hypothetical protein
LWGVVDGFFGGECHFFEIPLPPFLPFGLSEKVTFSDRPQGIFGITQKLKEEIHVQVLHSARRGMVLERVSTCGPPCGCAPSRVVGLADMSAPRHAARSLDLA